MSKGVLTASPELAKDYMVLAQNAYFTGSDSDAIALYAKAAPMASGELDKVKGLHIHFTTPGNNTTGPLGPEAEGWHFVNHTENNLGNGNALPIAGPGYSGLCGAALNSPALTIPGQNPATGIGGGC